MYRSHWVSVLMLGLSLQWMLVGLVSLVFPWWFARFWADAVLPSLTLPWRMLGLAYLVFSLLLLWILKNKNRSMALMLAILVYFSGAALLHSLSRAVKTDFLSVMVFDVPVLLLLVLVYCFRMPGQQQREQGVVKWYNPRKGYGFIRRPSGGDVFVQQRHLRLPDSQVLHPGQAVEFLVIHGEKGWYADEVRESHSL